MDAGRSGEDGPLDRAQTVRIEQLRATRSLEDLVDVTGRTDPDDAYLIAKRDWRELRSRQLSTRPVPSGVPGSRVSIDGGAVIVHGITHAGTRAEGEFLRSAVDGWLDDGAAVYCEQGIRQLYFGAYDDVGSVDDYSWSMRRLEEMNPESDRTLAAASFGGLLEEIDSLRSQIRDATFSLIESGRDVYGDRFARALGDVATEFLVTDGHVSAGIDFDSFGISLAAARDPTRLHQLQRYYDAAFLPQPVERAWLRRHDPELELVTHARNERIADFVCYHRRDDEPVRVIVGAAHQPGVRYYLEKYRDGERSIEDFEPLG